MFRRILLPIIISLILTGCAASDHYTPDGAVNWPGVPIYENTTIQNARYGSMAGTWIVQETTNLDFPYSGIAMAGASTLGYIVGNQVGDTQYPTEGLAPY